MARIRTIAGVLDLGAGRRMFSDARLLFIGLWTFCDDRGVHPASAKRIKMEIFPATTSPAMRFYD